MNIVSNSNNVDERISLRVKSESLPRWCEICHQFDEFDPKTSKCTRCSNIGLLPFNTDKNCEAQIIKFVNNPNSSLVRIVSLESHTINSLTIPHPPISVAIIFLSLWAIAAIISLLAISNIINFNLVDVGLFSFIASFLWLFCIIKILITICRKEGGIRHFFIDYAGMFSHNHSVDFDTEQCKVRFGYQLLGHFYYYIHIPLGTITSISWSSGQATHMAGKDMKDWYVAIRFYAGRSVFNHHFVKTKNEHVYIIKSSLPKEQAVALAVQLVAFLQEAGLPLT